jgi:hypothetical protein
MTRPRIVALSTGLVLAAGVTVALAGTPFGGDDTGTIPSGKTTLKCESSIAKGVGKAVGCIGKCTASRSSGKFADDAAEDACEKMSTPTPGKSCLEKFAASAAKAQSGDTTGGCNCVNVATLSTIIEGDLDSMNNAVYCDTTSGTPFGGDDTGDLPVAKSATAKCEDGVNKLVGKAVACIIKCHNSRASGKLADDTAEDACEKNNAGKSCLEKFTAGVTKAQSKDTSGGCNCINGATLANTIETTLDTGNSLTWCASPSGAFLE